MSRPTSPLKSRPNRRHAPSAAPGGPVVHRLDEGDEKRLPPARCVASPNTVMPRPRLHHGSGRSPHRDGAGFELIQIVDAFEQERVGAVARQHAGQPSRASATVSPPTPSSSTETL